MILKELYRTEQDGKTLVAIGNGSDNLDKAARLRLGRNNSFHALLDGIFTRFFTGENHIQFYALELSDFEKFNTIGDAELQAAEKLATEKLAAEKPKVYWSKPSHFPPICWIRDKTDDFCCLFINILDGEIDVKDVKDYRWSDRPFDRWEDGEECLVEE